MKRIQRYYLSLVWNNVSVMSLPSGTRVLTVREEGSTIVVYVEVPDQWSHFVDFKFLSLTTGTAIPAGLTLSYLATVGEDSTTQHIYYMKRSEVNYRRHGYEVK